MSCPPWQYTPGSDAALSAGCRCPVMDNNHGRYPPYEPNDWWISELCPMHYLTEESTSGRDERHPDTTGAGA
jgi:hypothetical protein